MPIAIYRAIFDSFASPFNHHRKSSDPHHVCHRRTDGGDVDSTAAGSVTVPAHGFRLEPLASPQLTASPKQADPGHPTCRHGRRKSIAADTHTTKNIPPTEP